METSFARPFDTARVAELSHDSAKLAWNARFSASTDLRVTAVHPTGLDWEVVRRLRRIYDKVPWIAHEIENHPQEARCASKFSYDTVAVEAGVLKSAYRPESFRARANSEIQQLLRNIDEMGSYYQN